MTSIERADLPALIPELRAFARTLTADVARGDALVRDVLVATLATWRTSTSADLWQRLEAMITAAAEQAGSVQPVVA